MSAKSPAIGIDHPTVVPGNSAGDDSAESSGNVSTDGSVAPRDNGRDES